MAATPDTSLLVCERRRDQGDALQPLLEEMRSIRKSIDDLVALLKLSREPSGEGVPVQVVLPPIDPEMLNNMLQAMALVGLYQAPNFRLTIAVPAGQTVIFPFALPDNYYCTKRSPVIFTSDHYDPAITINVRVDENYVATPYGLSVYPPGDAITLNFGEYWLKKRQVVFEFVNHSGYDANITFECNVSLVHETVYRDWYAPLVEFAKQRLNDVAVLMGGKAL